MLNSEKITNKYNLKGDSPLVIEGSRWHDLPEIFKELGFTVGVEVGTELGRYAKSLCTKVPNLRLYTIDPYVRYDLQNPGENYYELATERLAPFNCKIIKKFSMDALNDFEDESLDFVYIDGNHDFEHTTEDIAKWSKKVRQGGVISGHDFLNKTSPFFDIHVEDVVRGWVHAHKIDPWFIIKEKRKGNPSWFFFNETH